MANRKRHGCSSVLLIFILMIGGFAAVYFFGGFYREMFYPIKYEEYVEKYAEENGLDKYFVYAVIKNESNFSPEAVSGVGAVGLMQIMPDAFDWAKFKKKDERGLEFDDMKNPEYNIEYGTFMIGYYLNEFGGCREAMAAYHSGRGDVKNWLKDPDCSKDGKTLDVIPTPATASYVDKVMNTYEAYKNLYEER